MRRCISSLDAARGPERASVSLRSMATTTQYGGAPLPELQDVTSLFYNEERHELYIGNKQGILTVWAQ